MSKEQITVKLVLLGDSRVGKSSLVIRFVKNEFDQYKFPTIGATFLTQSVTVDNQYVVKFEIWDTAGQEKYRSLAPLYYRGAHSAVVVYDITNRESFENANTWIKELRDAETGVLIALAGNKVDLQDNRQVSIDEAEQYARNQQLLFMETSAKTNTNIKEIFKAIAHKIAERGPQAQAKPKGVVIEDDEPDKTKQGCPCTLI